MIAATIHRVRQHPRSALLARWMHRLTVFAAPAAAGAIMLEVNLPSARQPWSYVQGFVVAGAVLAVTLRMIRSRTEGFMALAGFYLGALSAIPFIWNQFFHSHMGWVALVVLSAALACPAFLTRKSWPVAGVLLALVLSVVPPLGLVGLGTPMLAAGAFFPGWGIVGMVMMLVFYGLSGVQHKLAVLAQIAMLGWAVLHMMLPAAAGPVNAWAATTYLGDTTSRGLTAKYAKIDRTKHLARQAIADGAKVIVLPEGSDTLWDDGQVFYWKDVAAKARSAGAHVLIGAYTNALFTDDRGNGLVDLATGHFFPAQVTIPIAMWRPGAKGSFPLHLSANALISTPAGKAAHLICYEELLMWPLATQGVRHPDFVVTAANQWFASGWLLRAQERSGKIQARLWGLPVVRSVNYAKVE